MVYFSQMESTTLIDNKMLVGAVEKCDLPLLQISELEVRIDTGAKTSSLHVDNIKEFKCDKQRWIEFDIHPDAHDVDVIVHRKARIKAKRTIKSSNAEKETRYIIETDIVMGTERWPIEISLSDRSGMTYLMLLGREAMAGRLLVDPGDQFLLP